MELSSLRSQLTGMMEYWNNGIIGWRPSGKWPGKHGKFVKRRKENTWHL